MIEPGDQRDSRRIAGGYVDHARRRLLGGVESHVERHGGNEDERHCIGLCDVSRLFKAPFEVGIFQASEALPA